MTDTKTKRVQIWKFLKLIISISIVIYLFFSFRACEHDSTSIVPESEEQGTHTKPKDDVTFGKIAYNIPEQMSLQEDNRVVVFITKSILDSAVFKNFDTSTFKIQKIKVASRIKANLIDPTKECFQINSLSTEEQFLDDSSDTFWEWDVKPLKSGKNKLILKATIKITNPLGDNYKDIPVFEQDVFVKSSPLISIGLFFKNYWQWITTAILIPLLVWIYSLMNKRLQMKKPKSKPVKIKKNGT